VPADVTYTGMYMQGSAGRTFMDCSTNTLYTVKDETSSLDTLFKKYFDMREAYDNEPIYAILKGTVSIVPANNGTPSNTQGILMVKKVDSLAHLNSRNCCIPFEYMAYGTEPFGDLKIFPEGKNMVFSVLGDTVATLCTTPPVQTLGDTKTYTTTTNTGKT
jgi:NlpE C-terminal OB domain